MVKDSFFQYLRRISRLAAVACLSVTASPAFAHSGGPEDCPAAGDTALIALPERTVEGCLDNGLRYLIFPNAVPAHTVEMRLVMRLGSVQENDRQKGCAHFLEHMAFAGTRHFPRRSMIDYLEGLGMKFGRDINAVTGYDRTVFMLTVPMTARDTGILDSTLLVLKDWLTGIDFKADRVQQERGVILEELRTYSTDDAFYGLKIGNSRFRDRMPLGSAEDIRRVKRGSLVDFYDKWYMPQLAGIVVVGDIAPQEVERRIQTLFGGIPQKDLQDYRRYSLTYPQGVSLQEVRDSISKNSVLDMMIPHVGTVGKDKASTVKKERERLAAYAVDRRLSARRIACSVSDEWYLADTYHWAFSFSAQDKPALLRQVERVASELRLLSDEGWHPEELARIKEGFVETVTVNEDGRSSATYCDDFTDYLLMGDRYLHTEHELEAVHRALRATEPAVLQRQVADILKKMQRQSLLAYQNNAGSQHGITKEEVAAAWQRGWAVCAPEYTYEPVSEETAKTVTPACLSLPLGNADTCMLSERKYPSTQVTEVRLKNGVRLVFRPTPQGEKTLLLNLLGEGGLASLPPAAYHRYESTAGFMEMGGIAKVPYDTLCNYMAQEGLLLNLSVGAYWHDLLGTVPAARSRELFRLIQEKLQRPEMCYADFEENRTEELKRLGKETVLEQLMQRAPDRLLVNRMDSLVGNAPFSKWGAKTAEDVQAMNLDSIAAYFRHLYGQLPRTTVVMTGNYDLETVKRQAVAAFGTLPAASSAGQWMTAVAPDRLSGTSYVEGFPNDNATQTVLEYVYPGHYKPSLQQGLILKLMRDLLQDRLLRVLREKENVVYSPYASLYYHGVPQNSYYFNLSLSVDTENSRRTDELVQEIIDSLQKEAVTEEELDKLKRAFLVNKQQVLTEEAATAWRDILASLVKNGEELEDFENYSRQLDGITPEMVRKAFRTYMPKQKKILLYLGKHQNYD